jgi:hypothetical protein
VSSEYGPRQAGDDAKLFAVSLKTRAAATSPEAATAPCIELIGAHEEKFGAVGLRMLVAHLVETTSVLVGTGPSTTERGSAGDAGAEQSATAVAGPGRTGGGVARWAVPARASQSLIWT